MVDSTLWKENVFENGHTAVWGSWFDTEAKRWGYACCKGLEKGGSCAVAEAAARDAPPPVTPSSFDSSSESEGTKKARMTEHTPLDWSKPPPELLPLAEVKGGDQAAYVEHFLTYCLGAWRRKLEDGCVGFTDAQRLAFGTEESLKQAQDWVTPLIWRLRKGETLERGERKEGRSRCRETRTSMEGKFVQEKNVLRSLTNMATLSYERDYFSAHRTYMALTLGNKMWNSTHVAHVSACTMKGAREYRRNRDSLNTYDNDPVSEKYMQAIKKVVHLAQAIRPSSDESKNVPL